MTSFEFPGEYYEIMRQDFRDLDAETAFLASCAPPGGRILDLGSGTGTNLRRLGALGHSCVGVDQSASFVEYARQAGGEGVEYVHGRAEEFSTDRRFDLAYSLFTTLNQLPHDSVRTLFETTRRHLAPGGRLVLEFGHLLNFVESYQQHTVAHHRSDGVLITRLARQSLHPHTATWRHEETLLVRRPDGRVALYDNFFDQSVLTGPEVRGLLADAGFTVTAEYGGFREEPAPGHGRGPLVIVASPSRKAAI